LSARRRKKRWRWRRRRRMGSNEKTNKTTNTVK
jgi:hypothetical protein